VKRFKYIFHKLRYENTTKIHPGTRTVNPKCGIPTCVVTDPCSPSQLEECECESELAEKAEDFTVLGFQLEQRDKVMYLHIQQ
jgi:hypothetical protein